MKTCIRTFTVKDGKCVIMRKCLKYINFAFNYMKFLREKLVELESERKDNIRKVSRQIEVKCYEHTFNRPAGILFSPVGADIFEKIA